MTSWRKAISWSKFELALKCPLRLQKVIDKAGQYHSTPNEAAFKGKLVQRCFELYFNQELNLRAKGQDPEVLQKIMSKVLANGWFEKEPLHLKESSSVEEVLEQTRKQLASAYDVCNSAGLLNKVVRSEVKWMSVFQGHRLFGMLDFVVGDGPEVELWDGKGYKEKNADPNQLLYYALAMHASGKRVVRGGFLYWMHGPEDVDLSTKELHKFVSDDFAKGMKVFTLLHRGVEKLEATPSEESCRFCPWKSTCEHSFFFKGELSVYGEQEVSFGETDGLRRKV